MGAERALRCGLVSEIYSTQTDMDMAAASLADDMLANSAIGLRHTKDGLNQNIDAPSLEAALALEDRTQNLISVVNAVDINKRMRMFVKVPQSKL